MSGSGGAISAFAQSFNGAPYVYGGTSPQGWDCSGFVQYVLAHFGITAPRTSEEQWAWAEHVPASQLAPGDLVFAQFPGDNSSPGHVGIYIGGGNVISAQDPKSGTGISSLASWGNAIVGYGQPPGQSPGGTTSASLTSVTSDLGGLFGLPSEVTQFFSQADTFIQALMWLARPSSWLRIGAFLAGVALLLFAIHALIAAAGDKPIVSAPSAIPVPV